MKKIIWIAFTLLIALWTGLVALALQLVNWILASIATAQVPGAALNLSQMAVPKWAAGLVDPAWLAAAQGGMEWVLQALVQVLPAVTGLGSLVAVAGWVLWAIVVVGLLALALILTRQGFPQRAVGAARSRAGRHSSSGAEGHSSPRVDSHSASRENRHSSNRKRPHH
jgi:hypothetical protein